MLGYVTAEKKEIDNWEVEIDTVRHRFECASVSILRKISGHEAVFLV